MSFLSQAYLLEKYGLRLTTEQLAEALGMAHGTLRNKISAGKLSVPTYLDGGNRYADYRDVAAYMDEQRKKAHEPLPA